METIHKKDVQKLNELEQGLMDIIVEINNDTLNQRFLAWQKQRHKCNEGYNKYLDELMSESKKQNQEK